MSVWLSVDPLAHEFPSWTPYHFVHNNPLNLIDPNGMSAEEPGWLKGFFQKIGNWTRGKGWWTNTELKKMKDSEMLDEVVITAKKPKNKQKKGQGFWGESDEQLIDWPEAENGPDDYNEKPEMGGSPSVANGPFGKKVAKALNIVKDWIPILSPNKDKSNSKGVNPTVDDPPSNSPDTLFQRRYDNVRRDDGWYHLEPRDDFDIILIYNDGDSIVTPY